MHSSAPASSLPFVSRRSLFQAAGALLRLCPRVQAVAGAGSPLPAPVPPPLAGKQYPVMPLMAALRSLGTDEATLAHVGNAVGLTEATPLAALSAFISLTTRAQLQARVPPVVLGDASFHLSASAMDAYDALVSAGVSVDVAARFAARVTDCDAPCTLGALADAGATGWDVVRARFALVSDFGGAGSCGGC